MRRPNGDVELQAMPAHRSGDGDADEEQMPCRDDDDDGGGGGGGGSVLLLHEPSSIARAHDFPLAATSHVSLLPFINGEACDRDGRHAQTPPIPSSSSSPPPPPIPSTGWASWFAGLAWFLIACSTHLVMGAYVVLLRYAQINMNLPAFSLTGLSFGACLLVVFVLAMPPLKRVQWRSAWRPLVALFAVTIVLRNVSNVFSLRYTKAAFVQMVSLSIPFFVVLLERCVYKRKIPLIMLLTIIGCAFGGAMMLSSNLFKVGFAELSTMDIVGLALAMASSFFLAAYMVLIKVISLTADTLFSCQIIVTTAYAMICSFVVSESWEPWSHLDAWSWIAFFAIALFVLWLANVVQLQSIKRIGAGAVSSLLPLRLVSSMLLGWVLLGETFTSPLQLIGAGLVMTCVSLFLWRTQVNTSKQLQLQRAAVAAQMAAEQQVQADRAREMETPTHAPPVR